MQFKDLDARWRVLTEEVITGMQEWRQQHPKATFREIETALDERLARVRARMLEDAALLSRSADLTANRPWRVRNAEPRCNRGEYRPANWSRTAIR